MQIKREKDMAKRKNIITEYRNYYLPPHFPVIALSGDYWKISDRPSGHLHFHNCLEIGICHSDSGCLEFYGEPAPFKEGDITVIPRNVPHTTYSSPGLASHWSYIYLDPRELFRHLLPADWKNYDLLSYGLPNYKYIFAKEEHPFLYQMADYALKELTLQSPGYQISSRGLLLSLYIALYRIQNPAEGTSAPEDKAMGTLSSTTPIVLSPALDYVENNYMQQFSVDFLADLCHLSPTHFRRLFHNIMGTSPLDFINNTRIQKSCILLYSTEESILNISGMVGFQSVSSYNRCFVRTMQTTPRDYRKAILQSDKNIQNQSILEYSGWMYPEQ